MRRVVVGTAGHIDHGKTTLLEALTGVDCDRWSEEKERGITIDLGFAHRVEGDLQIGFVDVPGHERFLHNALAGLGGIRVMLLVVAADEGVEPQTREHLAICSLLGIPEGLVALTKTDLVSPDLVDLARLEVEELLEPTPFAGAEVMPVSARTGDGVEALWSRLVAIAERHATGAEGGDDTDDTDDRPARLPIDRAFHLKGLGAVVTGTLASGELSPGDALELLPDGLPARVRGVQVHGEDRARAEAGERTSLQLGGVDLDRLIRGQTLAPPDTFGVTRRLCVRFTLLADAPKPIEGWTPVRVHLLSSRVLGELRPLGPEKTAETAAGPAVLRPGDTGPVEIRLAAPLVAVRGDRVIVRRPSPQSTLGGGEVLDPAWRRRPAARLPRVLERLSGSRRDALALWIADAGEAGIESAPLARRLGIAGETIAPDLAALGAEGKTLAVPAGAGHERRWLAAGAYARVARRAERVLTDYFERERLAAGMPKAEAIDKILPGRAAEIAGTYLRWLQEQKVLTVDGDRVGRPGREARLSGEESALARRVRARLDDAGLAPPSPARLAADLGAKPAILDGVLRFLVERGRLSRLPGGLLIAGPALDRLAGELAASGWESFTVAQFKDRFGLSRKWAIPLLEHLDSIGVTRRRGDERTVVRRPPS